MLKATDLPAGWTSTPHEADPEDAADQTALAKCVGGKDNTPDQVAEADSPDFSFNDASVSSSANSFKSQADIADDLAILHSPKLSPCFEQLLKAELPTSLPAGSTVDSVTFAVTPGAAGGLANVVGTGAGTVLVTTAGKKIAIYIDVAFIEGPLIEAEVQVENLTQPVPAAFFATLTKTVATRAAKG